MKNFVQLNHSQLFFKAGQLLSDLIRPCAKYRTWTLFFHLSHNASCCPPILFLNNLLQNTVRCVRKTIIVTRKLNAKTGGVCAREEPWAMGNTVVVCYSTNISTEAHVPTPRFNAAVNAAVWPVRYACVQP